MVQVTYPGVYVQEVSSGVRTIAGVSTSVAAFVGKAKLGPINKPVRLLSFGDFERRFGGLDADMPMTYAVRQFFVNGGAEAWVVRLVKDPHEATYAALNGAGSKVLLISALDAGLTGNDIQVWVDRNAANSNSDFNLTLVYAPAGAPADRRTETFRNLSMNSRDPRYVESVVNGASELVTVRRHADVTEAVPDALPDGTSSSGELVDGDGNPLDVKTRWDSSHDQFRVSVNGLPPVTIQIEEADFTWTPADTALKNLCDRIAAKVQGQPGAQPALSGFKCYQVGNRITMESGDKGEASSVRVLPGGMNDISARLKLGMGDGALVVDGAAQLRPVEVPAHGTLTGAAVATFPHLPSGDHRQLDVSLDGDSPQTASVDDQEVDQALSVAERLKIVAGQLEAAVRKIKPGKAAYDAFTCTVTADQRLVLASGTRGAGSSVVANVPVGPSAKPIATELGLVGAGVQVQRAPNTTLSGGTESGFGDNDYGVFVGSEDKRTGMHALASVDLFNILCLPGISDAGILAEAGDYCRKRRAFLVIDAPQNVTKPEDMVQTALGTGLPNTDYAAVYYPWVQVPDPLLNGKPRAMPPSGTVAGLYARTDATRGVWKAPAGTDAQLTNVQGLAYALTDDENGLLNPLAVNCLRVLRAYGPVCWGSRTLAGKDATPSDWKYIPVRRLALYIEESLYRGTQWVVFEPNDEPLWAQIRLNVGAFMHDLFRQGAFAGIAPRDAYFVRCDSDTTTQTDINSGVVNILVGFAPLKPAEFVVITLQQTAGQIQA